VRCQDLLEDLALLEWAGVGFGSTENFRLHLSLKAFADRAPAEVSRVRIWGRVNTRARPYFVLEGLSEELSLEAHNSSASLEGRDGVNKHSYWVSPDPATVAWTQLPHATCEQIVVARKVRVLLTGDLTAAVPSYPPFPGVEAHLLRALIAVVTGCTSISPDGFFEVAEDSEPPVLVAVVPEEDKVASDLLDAGAWKLHEREVNARGRVTAVPAPADGDEEEPEAAEGEEVEVPAYLADLRPDAWAFRICPGGTGGAASSAVVARSLEWPGAVAVCSGKKSVCLYVGDLRLQTSPAVRLSPALPAVVQTEWRPEEDAQPLTEQPDPIADPNAPPPVDEPAAEEGADVAENDDE
jgi:radial spoke head protein 4A